MSSQHKTFVEYTKILENPNGMRAVFENRKLKASSTEEGVTHD